MKLYQRDFNIITKEEDEQWKIMQENENILPESIIKKSMFLQYPAAIRHYLSLFPNNYLDVVELKNIKKLNDLKIEFCALINDVATTERDILNFIQAEKAF